MTSRERVLTTIAHTEPDRVPLDFGATMETTIHLKAYAMLKEKLHILTDKEAGIKLLTAQFADVDQEIQEKIGADVRGVQPVPPANFEIRYEKKGEYTQFTDEFGISWRKSDEDGLYFDMFKHPLAEMELEDIENYPFPDPREPSRFAGLSERIDTLSADGEFPIVFDNCWGNGIFQMCNQMMGYDQFLIAMALGEKKADYMLDKILDLKMNFWDEVLERFGDRIDIVKELDDLGTQINLLLSPEMYQDKIKPRLTKLVNSIKKKAPHVKMMMHSCGSIRKVIPDLIDAGVEILNPIQYTAEDMDPATLKKEFGKDLTFWGGGMETQKIMPMGTVQEVKDETRRQLDILMPGGGFVFAQVHSLQWGVPFENMMAMWETVKEYGSY
ncbi:MAG: uroporphyrinogen decarboxylase family protein [Spirochaetales bacterium]|nr:uroporphyrinogen decarboxylase family protein [Spirochaetales bacterium]